MKDIFVVADNIYSPLGATTAENFAQLRRGIRGVRPQARAEIAEDPFYAALFDPGICAGNAAHTKFEQLLIASVGDTLATAGIDPADDRTILILSTTKGNIALLEEGEGNIGLPENGEAGAARLTLGSSARLLARHFGFVNPPLVVSNACISGVLAILTGMRLIRSGRYDTAVVVGADTVTRFVFSGFASFQALSAGPCRPFDQARDGINLGEAAATVVLSAHRRYRGNLRIRGGAMTNDANHISGPSRTGEELAAAIARSLAEAGCRPSAIGHVSAHGTATQYNDEMEARAITLAGLQAVPVNSLKGYYGHTLGAAGLVESIVTLQTMREDLVLPSPGFETNGVSTPLHICTSPLHVPLDHCLKTASGFGGCNAAMVISK
ncbi:MAG TPA: beta-ketoacyl synthase N-terminal-like domain-containing protein [Puia sp.]|nr:beta-ketoacyl synthase N-terminal-like domain-containing protein [Puia sp.]